MSLQPQSPPDLQPVWTEDLRLALLHLMQVTDPFAGLALDSLIARLEQREVQT